MIKLDRANIFCDIIINLYESTSNWVVISHKGSGPNQNFEKFDGEVSKISEDPMTKFHKLGGGREGGPEMDRIEIQSSCTQGGESQKDRIFSKF